MRFQLSMFSIGLCGLALTGCTTEPDLGRNEAAVTQATMDVCETDDGHVLRYATSGLRSAPGFANCVALGQSDQAEFLSLNADALVRAQDLFAAEAPPPIESSSVSGPTIHWGPVHWTAGLPPVISTDPGNYCPQVSYFIDEYEDCITTHGEDGRQTRTTYCTMRFIRSGFLCIPGSETCVDMGPGECTPKGSGGGGGGGGPTEPTEPSDPDPPKT